MSRLEELCIVPLNDGTWTCAKGQSIFFSKGESNVDIPSGIEVLIVNPSAESDPDRQKLYKQLGVKKWEAPEICRLVLKVHASPDFEPKSLNRDQLVSHAAFLWKASWQPPKGSKLWFANTRDERCLGTSLYIRGSVEADSAAARIFAKLEEKFSVIHRNYLDKFSDDSDWAQWLIKNLGLSMIPRLIAPFIDPKPQPAQSKIVIERIPLAEPFPSKQNGAITEQGPALSTTGLSDAVDAVRTTKQETPDASKTRKWNNHKERTSTWHRRCFTGLSDAVDAIRTTKQETPDDGKTRKWKDYKDGPKTMNSPPAIDDVDMIFDLSEEFKLMFSQCDTSDVLQILRDNWQEYSQWVDGAHMQWQDKSFVASSTKLKSVIGRCLIQTLGLKRAHLNKTVLAMIDTELDSGCAIPSVSIQDPAHIGRNFLRYFGVIIKSDIHYYLRCLVSMAEHLFSDVDKVSYIYWKIQSMYRGNERVIRYVIAEIEDGRS